MDEEVSARDVVVHSIRTRIDEEGDGLPLVLVHGLGGPQMWERIIEPLSQNFHVVSVHLPGFGESDCPPSPFTTDEYADFLCNLLDTLNIQSTSIVGISYGGQIAATFSCRHPKVVDKLVLIASTGLKDYGILRKRFIWKIIAGGAKHLVLKSEWLTCLFGRRSFYNSANRPNDLCRKFHEQIMRDGKTGAWLNALWNVVSEENEFRQQLKSLQMPTLILWGKDDRILPPRYADELHRMIPNSTVTLLDECGHSVPLEKVEKVCNALLDS